jgi:hypothetical protein
MRFHRIYLGNPREIWAKSHNGKASRFLLLDPLGDARTEFLAKHSEAIDVIKSQGSPPVLLRARR